VGRGGRHMMETRPAAGGSRAAITGSGWESNLAEERPPQDQARVHERLDGVTARMGSIEDALTAILTRLNLPSTVPMTTQPTTTLTRIDRLNAREITTPGGVGATGGATAVGLHYDSPQQDMGRNEQYGQYDGADTPQRDGPDGGTLGENPTHLKDLWDFRGVSMSQPTPFKLTDMTPPPQVKWTEPNALDMSQSPAFPPHGSQEMEKILYVSQLVMHMIGVCEGAMAETGGKPQRLWLPAPTYGKRKSVCRGFWSKQVTAAQGVVDLREYIPYELQEERLLFSAIQYLLANGSVQQKASGKWKGVILLPPAGK